MPPSPAGLAPRLGHSFRDPHLLEQALTHSSYVNEHPEPPIEPNERLEFLGDAVLSLVISEALWERHPHDAEGVLTARRAAIVSARDLARIAARLDLGEYLLLGQGAERSGERRRGSVLASTFEAVVAAVYLDGGFEAARRMVLDVCGPELDRPVAPVSLKSPKSRLQELAYRRSGRPPSYRVLSVEGPAHDRRYQVEVAFDGAVLGSGHGRSRRDAETEAAAMALESLAEAGPEPVDGTPAVTSGAGAPAVTSGPGTPPFEPPDR